MKKHLLVLAVAALTLSFGTTKAQIFGAPWDGFEKWTPDLANPAVKDPNAGTAATPGWQCLNPLTNSFFGGAPQSVFQDSATVYSGKYSCKIVSVNLGGAYSYVKGYVKDTCGILFAGSILTTPSPKITFGVPFSRRITALTFYYQYAPQTNKLGKVDTAICGISLTHYTTAHGVSTLGAGELKMMTAGTWTMGTVPIFYDSTSGNPDTIQIIWSATSNYFPALGSILLVDQISTNPAGLDNITANTASVDVYPNPASTEVNFHITTTNGQLGYSIAVYDITGKKVSTYPVRNNVAEINTSGYSTGLYFYQLYDESGNQMKVGKFSVVR